MLKLMRCDLVTVKATCGRDTVINMRFRVTHSGTPPDSLLKGLVAVQTVVSGHTCQQHDFSSILVGCPILHNDQGSEDLGQAFDDLASLL